MKNSKAGFYLISLTSMFVFLLIQVFDPPVIRDHLESKTYDLRLHLRNLVQGQPLNNDIVIVAIDENSLAQAGRWPWSRSVMAGLVGKIGEGRPKVIGIDILFAEKETAEADGQLARAVRKAGNVVLAAPFVLASGDEHMETPANVPDFLWDSAFMEVKTVSGIDWKRFANKSVKVIPPREDIARGGVLGHVTARTDMDGVLRSEILALNFGDDCYPSLSLQVARIALGVRMQDMTLFGGSSIRLGDRVIPTDLSGQVLINYRGKENSFPYVSAVDVLKGTVDADLFRGKIVLLGTSALATYDQKITPFSGNMPGVEKNASVVQNILLNDFNRKSPGVAELMVILVTSLSLIIVLPRLKATPGVFLAFSLMGSYFLFTCYLLFRHHLWLNLLAPTANMAVIFTASTISRLFSEEIRAREIRAMFSSYVTERLVDEMIRHPEMARLGGEMREVTVLFADVKGFTGYSESHQPEEVVSILNEYLGAMTEIILKWEGILDKFIGDAIVVFWGAPMKQDDHAERGVRCALDMQERLAELRGKWEAEGKSPLTAGIGLNTGEVIVGNIGAEGKKMDYTVIGDHVNLGARVEGLTRHYDQPVLMTEYTLEKLRPVLLTGAFRGVSFHGLERVVVKGKETPVAIYAVSSLEPHAASVVVECDPAQVIRLAGK